MSYELQKILLHSIDEFTFQTKSVVFEGLAQNDPFSNYKPAIGKFLVADDSTPKLKVLSLYAITGDVRRMLSDFVAQQNNLKPEKIIGGGIMMLSACNPYSLTQSAVALTGETKYFGGVQMEVLCRFESTLRAAYEELGVKFDVFIGDPNAKNVRY